MVAGVAAETIERIVEAVKAQRILTQGTSKEASGFLGVSCPPFFAGFFEVNANYKRLF
ncbi:hypothetical protein Q9189_003251 [Teloschistes chrysophthalmus]